MSKALRFLTNFSKVKFMVPQYRRSIDIQTFNTAGVFKNSSAMIILPYCTHIQLFYSSIVKTKSQGYFINQSGDLLAGNHIAGMLTQVT